MEIAGAGPHRQVIGRHRFQVVVEHVGLGRYHDFQRTLLAQEVRCQDFNRRVRVLGADGANDIGEVLRPAIGKVVAVDRGDDDMAEAHLLDRMGDAGRLTRVECRRNAGGDVTEGAGTRADLAHDHEGGVLLVPALADIGAAGLLAHRHQFVRTHDLARFRIALGYRRLDANPVGLTQHFLVRPMGLLGVAGARCGGYRIENRDHMLSNPETGCWPAPALRFHLSHLATGKKAAAAHAATAFFAWRKLSAISGVSCGRPQSGYRRR